MRCVLLAGEATIRASVLREFSLCVVTACEECARVDERIKCIESETKWKYKTKQTDEILRETQRQNKQKNTRNNIR